MTWLRPLLAAGAWFALAARAAFAPLVEGTPVLWGNAADTQTPIGLTNLVAIDAGDSHVLGLRADGTVVTWAVRNGFIAPVPPGLDHIVAIAAGSSFNLALDRSGRIHGWGADNHVSRETIVNPPGWLTNVVSITAGYDSSAALTSDGYLIQWGSSHLGNLSGPLYPPSPRSYAIGQQFLVVAEGSGRLNLSLIHI
jgi:alpha-tubulin suppressor-like RCC1 family protein